VHGLFCYVPGSELNDGEEVREVVTKHVASAGDGVVASSGAGHGKVDGIDGAHDLDLEPGRVVVLEVSIHLTLQIEGFELM